MNDVGNRFGQMREKTRAWFQRAMGSAPRAVPWIVRALGFALAAALAIAAILIVVRAGETIALAFGGTAPLLGRALGYLFVAALLAAGVALFFIALAAVVRLSAWGLAAILTLGAAKTSTQSERYVIAGLLALLPGTAAYVVLMQDAFQALPLELKQHLVPVLLPFAVGAIAAPVWGKRQAITVTVLALLAVGAIVVGAGYLWPAVPGAAAAGPLSAVWHWADLMRQSTAIQRLWWMLMALLAVLIWAIAVFAGFREREM